MLGIFFRGQHRGFNLGINLPLVQFVEDHLPKGLIGCLMLVHCRIFRNPGYGVLAAGGVMILPTLRSLHHFHKGLVRYL